MKNNIKINSYASFPDALDSLAAELARREFSAERYYVVLTPDRYTQTVEQALFCGRSRYAGALDLEVLTLSRLAQRVYKGESLSQEAGVIVTARAVAAVKSELKYYARAAEFSDFAREAYTAIGQIAASDVAINSIPAFGATAAKLNDLALIQAQYNKLKGNCLDASDKLTMLIQNADCAFIKNAHFFAIGYADPTKLINHVFAALAAHAKSFELYDAPLGGQKRDCVDLFCAPDKICEYKNIATEIRDHVYNGGRYDDVAIICEKPRALKRILAEYQIPSYTDESSPLYNCASVSAIENVYKLSAALRRGVIDCSALVSAAKNPYLGCDMYDAERLLFDVSSRALSFVPQDYTFAQGVRAAARVLKVARAFGNSGCFAAAVRALIELCDFTAVQNAIAKNQTDCVAPIMEIVRLLDAYGAAEFDVDAKAFFAAALATDINTLPRERDCVTVTTAGSLRMSRVKKLFITDFNEGVVPQTVAETGLISDAELNALGGLIQPTVRGRNRVIRDELKAVVLNAQSVYITYCSAVGRPAAILGELTNNVNKLDYSENASVLLSSDDAEYIAKQAGAPAAAREIVARKLSAHSVSVQAATEKTESSFMPFADKIELQHKPTLSVSELSHWFTCPYQRFLRDAVGLKERRSGFTAPDFGIVVHDFMRRFVDTDLDCSIPTVKAIIDDVLKERGLQPDGAAYGRMVADAADYAAQNAAVIKKGLYVVERAEYKFGGKTFGQNAKLEFIGFIDRYDVCGNRARIIDYKTGNKSFDVNACADGTDMQLPLYAYALDREVTGMFYVRPTKRYSTTESADRALSGCMVMDVDVARQYDTDLDVGVSSDVIPVKLKLDKKSGVITFAANKALFSREDFNALIMLCKRNADVAADEIVDGYIMRSPVDGACDYCPFVGICGGALPRDKVVAATGEEEEQ